MPFEFVCKREENTKRSIATKSYKIRLQSIIHRRNFILFTSHDAVFYFLLFLVADLANEKPCKVKIREKYFDRKVKFVSLDAAGLAKSAYAAVKHREPAQTAWPFVFLNLEEIGSLLPWSSWAPEEMYGNIEKKC